jgi:hypothetical protein
MEVSSGVLFLWTKDAPHSEGTAREWIHNRDTTHRPYLLAVERGATLPADADPDIKRIGLPVFWWRPPGTFILDNTTPRCRQLPPLGPARTTLAHEVWNFARSLLVPLV